MNLLLTLLSAIFLQTAPAPDGVTASGVQIDRQGDYISVRMDLDLNALRPRHDEAILLTPVLVAGDNELELPAVGLYGRGRYYYYLRKDAARVISGPEETSLRPADLGTPCHYEAMRPWQPWMQDCRLELREASYGCCGKGVQLASAALSDFRYEEPDRAFRPDFAWVHPDAEVKSRSISGHAYIDFPVNDTEVRPAYHNNTRELGRIRATIDSVRINPDYTVRSISIRGFASPEGPYDGNARLAAGRSEAIRPFLMASSAFVNSGREICEISISPSHLRESSAQAAANPVPVHVERLAAKVSVAAAATSFDVPAVTPQGGIATRVEILGWGLNGTNRKAYHFKKIQPSWTFTWNNASLYRSHWAEDPNYTGGTYPLGGPSAITAGDDLGYKSWAQLTSDFGDWEYCLENTADASILPTAVSANALYPKTTHVLVKARLGFRIASGTDPAGYTTESDFYRYKGIFYTRHNLWDAIAADQALAGVRYWTDGALSVAATAADIRYVHRPGEGQRMVIVPAPGITLYRNGTPVTEDDTVEIDGFKDGRFYYKVPVEHLNNAAESSVWPTGRYGIVRNHAYSLALADRADGVGTGIWDPDEPIVPVVKAREYEVSAYVTVSPWTQIEQRFLFYDPTNRTILFGALTDGQRIDRFHDDDGWYEE